MSCVHISCSSFEVFLSYFQASNIDAAFKACKEVLEMDENNIEAICDLADTYLANDQFDEGG